MKIIMIPFYDPEVDLVSSYPTKVVLDDKYIEIFCFNIGFSDYDDSGIKKERTLDCTTLILKSQIASLEYGKIVKKEGWVVSIFYLDRSEGIYFENKKEAKELYLELKSWLFS